MTEAAVLDDLASFVEERWWDDCAASTAAAETLGLGASRGTVGGGVLVRGLASCGGIQISLWGGWNGGMEL